MKGRYGDVALLAVAVVMLGWGAAWGTEQRNVLKNPGFEHERLPLMYWMTLPDNQVTMEVVEEGAHSGKRALSVVDKADKKPGYIVSTSQIWPVPKGMKLQLSIWAKGKGKVRLGIREGPLPLPEKPRTGTAGKKGGPKPVVRATMVTSKPFELIGDWKQLKWIYEPAGNVPESSFVVVLEDSTGHPDWKAVLDDAFCGKASQQKK